MSNAQTDVRELVIELAQPDELFEDRPSDVATGRPWQSSGIDRIRNGLSAGSLRARVTTLIVLPRGTIEPRLDQGIREAVARYCEDGIREAENELKAIRREGVQALVLGAILLAVFLGLSEAVLQSDLPNSIRTFFGDGLFIVAAWVGMWYPLDTLLYAGRPYRVERSLLRAMQGMDIVVRPQRP
jgi:hypothetical protein